VRLANVSQQFTQGDVNNTGNVLDMGIQGNGFFILSDNGSLSYTRAGAFKTDAQNYVVDNNGNRLQGLWRRCQRQDHQRCVDRPEDRYVEPEAESDYQG
jgi:flagellar hook-basal body protein